MNKLELTKDGQRFNRAMRVLLGWLAIGGEVKTESGHTIIMTQDGNPGFLATRYKDGVEDQIILNVGSDTVWMFLVSHAKLLKEEDIIILSYNTTMNNRVDIDF